MEWTYLLIAGILEVAWAIGLKFSQGFTKLVPSVFTIAGMIASFYFLSLAMKNLPLGTAYAIWTGIGTIGTVIFGVLFFREPLTIVRIFCVLLIVAGIIGLKVATDY